jgi:hypothetical protein
MNVLTVTYLFIYLFFAWNLLIRVITDCHTCVKLCVCSGEDQGSMQDVP